MHLVCLLHWKITKTGLIFAFLIFVSVENLIYNVCKIKQLMQYFVWASEVMNQHFIKCFFPLTNMRKMQIFVVPEVLRCSDLRSVLILLLFCLWDSSISSSRAASSGLCSVVVINCKPAWFDQICTYSVCTVYMSVDLIQSFSAVIVCWSTGYREQNNVNRHINPYTFKTVKVRSVTVCTNVAEFSEFSEWACACLCVCVCWFDGCQWADWGQ